MVVLRSLDFRPLAASPGDEPGGSDKGMKMTLVEKLLLAILVVNVLVGAYLFVSIWCVRTRLLHQFVLLRDIRNNSMSCMDALFFLIKKSK